LTGKKSIIEPSADIDEKYQSYNFLLDSGQVVTGSIVEETPTELKVLVDPLARRDPLTLQKDEIDEQVKSPVSIMPAGLLSKLTEEEVIDLIAYVFARGNSKHPLYQSDHHHHDH
jgi:putative heme-binding domain-containing protein